MKRINLIALTALCALVGQIAYPYAIMNSKDSASSAVVYVFAGTDKYKKYLSARQVPDTVIDYASKASAFAPAIGAALAAPTAGASLLVAEAVPMGVMAAKYLKEALKWSGLTDLGLRKLAGIVAIHWDVKPGNQGRGAEWSWADIEKEYGVKRGQPMFVVITDKKNGDPLLQTSLTSDGRLGFIIKKDAKGQLSAELSPAAANEYTPSKGAEEESVWTDIKNYLPF